MWVYQMKKKLVVHHEVFIDTAEKAKEREEYRQRIQKIQEDEIRQAKYEEEIRAKNRKIGQLSLTETTLSQFTKKKEKNKNWW
jgi:hypothetical protein